MSISATSSLLAQNPVGPASDRLPVRTLNQQDFLKLVVAQLTTQDPLNPQKDTEFIAQMAQFTTLEQSKSMQGDIAGLRSDQHLLQANALLGRFVGLQTPDGRLARGTVSAIHLEAGKPQIMVNDQPYEVSDVVSIEAAGPNS